MSIGSSQTDSRTVLDMGEISDIETDGDIEPPRNRKSRAANPSGVPRSPTISDQRLAQRSPSWSDAVIESVTPTP